MFHYNHEKNQRQLVLCMKEKVEDCYQIGSWWGKTWNNRTDWGRWHLFNATTIKLTETKMWLKRPESNIGYERRVSLKEPMIANYGRQCYIFAGLNKVRVNGAEKEACVVLKKVSFVGGVLKRNAFMKTDVMEHLVAKLIIYGILNVALKIFHFLNCINIY